MQVEEQVGGTLVVTNDGTRFAIWMLLLGGALGLGAAYDAVAGGSERLVGLLGGAGTLLAIGLATFERSCFTFDPKSRTAQWRRRWAWWSDEGSLAFSQITGVLVHSPIGDHGVPSRRICLCVTGRRDLPLTASFRPDFDGAILALGDRLRALIGCTKPQAANASVASDNVAALARAGRRIDAVKLLRQTKGVGLKEAMREVVELERSAR